MVYHMLPARYRSYSVTFPLDNDRSGHNDRLPLL